MPLYEYRCVHCDREFEEIRRVADRHSARCPSCGGDRPKLLICMVRAAIKFPEGVYHGLPDEPHISSKRQLREECKKAGTDEFTECYARYDDGYGGY